MDMPATTTLPDWFWYLFYAVLIITLSVSIFSIKGNSDASDELCASNGNI